MGEKRSFLSLPLVIIFAFLSSCSNGDSNVYSATVSRSDTLNNDVVFYIDNYSLKLSKGIFDLTILSSAYFSNDITKNPDGERLVNRKGVYHVDSTTGDSQTSIATLNVSLADSVLIQQTGKGFSELQSKGDAPIIINTDKWDSSMESYGYNTPLEIRQCFGSPTQVCVSPSPNALKESAFVITKLPPIFMPITTK